MGFTHVLIDAGVMDFGWIRRLLVGMFDRARPVPRGFGGGGRRMAPSRMLSSGAEKPVVRTTGFFGTPGMGSR